MSARLARQMGAFDLCGFPPCPALPSVIVSAGQILLLGRSPGLGAGLGHLRDLGGHRWGLLGEWRVEESILVSGTGCKAQSALSLLDDKQDLLNP